MNALETALLAVLAFGVGFGAFALWLIWPRAEPRSRAKPDIKPAE